MRSAIVNTLLFTVALASIGCARNNEAPGQEPPRQSLIVNSQREGACAIFSREFNVDCKESNNQSKNPKRDQPKVKSAAKKDNEAKQAQVEKNYPLRFRSKGKNFPNEGSWRKTARQINDILKRPIWSPEKNRVANMIDEFDMVLYVNVAQRSRNTRSRSSAQRMQVFIRQGQNFTRTHNWKVSTGRPNGDKKIATYTGVFKIDSNRIHEEYRSAQFEDANMYETMFLYHIYKNGNNTGVAIHGTESKRRRLGRRDSGGCIRLDRRNSRCLYNTIRGDSNTDCLGLGISSLWAKVPSVNAKSSEMDPEYLTKGGLNYDGYRVLVAIIDDSRDNIRSKLLR